MFINLANSNDLIVFTMNLLTNNYVNGETITIVALSHQDGHP